jgi:hypothetical protein
MNETKGIFGGVFSKEIQVMIYEYNCDHRPLLNACFDELKHRDTYNKIMMILPKRLYPCRHCNGKKPVICCNVNFCSARCNKHWIQDHDELNEGFTLFDIEDAIEEYANDKGGYDLWNFTSQNFQYPGYDWKPGFFKHEPGVNFSVSNTNFRFEKSTYARYGQYKYDSELPYSVISKWRGPSQPYSHTPPCRR